MATTIQDRIIEKARLAGIDPASVPGPLNIRSDDYISNIAGHLGMDPGHYNVFDIEQALDEALGIDSEDNYDDYDDVEDEFDDSSDEYEEYPEETEQQNTDEHEQQSTQGSQSNQSSSDSVNKQKEEKKIENKDQKESENQSQKQNRLKKDGNEQNNEGNKKYRKSQYNKPGSNAPENAAENVAKTGSNAAKKGVEDAAKKGAENAAKKGAEQAAKKGAEQAAKKGAEQVAKAASSTLLKNPYFWLVIGILVLILAIVLFVVVLINSSSYVEYGTGEYEYVEMKYPENIVLHKDGKVLTMSIDDYVAGVLFGEVGNKRKSEEFLKAFSISIRSNGIKRMLKDGYVTSSSNFQVYKTQKGWTDQGSFFHDIAESTKGIVLITGDNSNPQYFYGMFDLIAYNSKCGGSETDNSIIMCQKQVEVPKSFLHSEGVSDKEIAHYKNHDYHGEGISMYGAYYLAIHKNYTAKDILNLFYSEARIVSYLPVQTTDFKVNLDIKVTDKGKTTCLKEPLNQFLQKNGTSFKAVNDGLLNAVKEAGPGTRSAVVTAGVYPILTMESMGKRLPYYLGGGWPYHGKGKSVTTYLGMDPTWGTYRKSGSYEYWGLDCASFVKWSFRNGGVNPVHKNDTRFGSANFKNKPNAPKYRVSTTPTYIGKPGDVLVRGDGGHVMLIVKTNQSKNGEISYYVAHASGYINPPNQILISKPGLSSLIQYGYYVVDMSWYYENQKISNFESEFNSKRLG